MAFGTGSHSGLHGVSSLHVAPHWQQSACARLPAMEMSNAASTSADAQLHPEPIMVMHRFRSGVRSRLRSTCVGLFIDLN
jgi:hypothetical protein